MKRIYTVGTVSCATEKGMRASQEDCSIAYSFVLPNGFGGTVLAVLDGHLGSMASEVCKKYIPKFFIPENEDDVYVAFGRLASKLDEKTRKMNCGTTLSVAFITKDNRSVYIAMLGDSPVIIFDRDGKTRVNLGHNINDSKKERLAAEARGGEYKKTANL